MGEYDGVARMKRRNAGAKHIYIYNEAIAMDVYVYIKSGCLEGGAIGGNMA